MNFIDGETYTLASESVLLPTPGATYKTVKSFSGGTWADSNIAVNATVGDVWFIRNNRTVPQILYVQEGQTMNGTTDDIFVIRKVETVEVEVVSGGYTVTRKSGYGMETFESSDGTLADCEAQALTEQLLLRSEVSARQTRAVVNGQLQLPRVRTEFARRSFMYRSRSTGIKSCGG